MKGIFIHKKTGNKYVVIGECLNCTNAQDGQEMVVYTRGRKTFVRETREFLKKLAPVKKPRTPIDLDYLIALYLQRKAKPVGEQELMRDMVIFAKNAWGLGFEVEVSFQENAVGDLVSPEIVSSLRRLRQSGLAKFDKSLFSFVKPAKSNDPRAAILPSHRRHIGAVFDDQIRQIVGSPRTWMGL